MVNKVILLGRLGKDPQVKFMSNGNAKCSFSVATDEKWTDKDGNKQEKCEWHNVVVWGKQAESCGQYLSKGRQVYIEGKVTTRSYDDKEGNKRYVTEIVARDVKFVGSKDDQRGTSNRAPAAAEVTTEVDEDEDIPY